MKITDGKGRGFEAGITPNRQVLVHSDSHPWVSTISHRDAQAYVLHSDFVSLTTTGSYSGILYVRNDSAVPLLVAAMATNSLAASQWRIIKNPTSGTLITGAVSGTATNANFTSANKFNGLVYRGADANTITDGDGFINWISGVGFHADNNGVIVLGQGNSLGFECKPSVATEVSVCVLAAVLDIGATT